MVPLLLQQVLLQGPQTLEYQICEIGSNPANCSTTSVTVNVFQAAVDAIVDDFTKYIWWKWRKPLHIE
jgi:hypothetical protein